MTRERFSPLEFVIVVGVAFGGSLFWSIQDVLHGRTAWNNGGWTFSTQDTIAAVLNELLLLPGLVAILYFGGWRRKDFLLGPGWRMTLVGVAIAAGMYLIDWPLTYYLRAARWEQAWRSAPAITSTRASRCCRGTPHTVLSKHAPT